MAPGRQCSGRLFEGGAVRCEDTKRNALPVSGDAQRALSAAWRAEHGAKDGGRNQADPGGRNEARRAHEGRGGAKCEIQSHIPPGPENAEVATRSKQSLKVPLWWHQDKRAFRTERTGFRGAGVGWGVDYEYEEAGDQQRADKSEGRCRAHEQRNGTRLLP
jgi:hypothetical protein